MHNLGINNLLNFWSEKIKDNLKKQIVEQNFLILIDEIDQKIKKIKSEKNSIEIEKKKEREKISQQKVSSGYGKKTFPTSLKQNIKEKEKEKKKNNIKDSQNNNITRNNNNNNIYNKGNERNVETSQYNRNDVNITKQIKSSDVDLTYKKEYLTDIKNLENNTFIEQEEKLGENILELSKKNQNIISFIDIDLFLQRIAQDKKIYDDMEDNDTALKGICIQHPIFISSNTFVSKIISCFNYFYTRYLYENSEKEKEKNTNQKKYQVSTEKNYQTNNKKTSIGYRSKYKQNEEMKIPIKDDLDRIVFVKNIKKIPYCLIDLLIYMKNIQKEH